MVGSGSGSLAWKGGGLITHCIYLLQRRLHHDKEGLFFSARVIAFGRIR